MADEPLRELLAFCRANQSFYRQRAQRFYERIGSESMCNADITSEQYRTRADALESALSELARLRAEREWKPQFDAIQPEQERLAIQFANEIAGPKGGKCSHPDPVRLLEMAAALYSAEEKQGYR